MALFVGLVVALCRRYVFRSKQLYTVEEDAVVLWLILAVVLTGFIVEGVRMSLGGTGAKSSQAAGKANIMMP